MFVGENISFDASLVTYNRNNIPPNYDYKQNIWKSKSSVVVACFHPGRAKDLSAPLQFIVTHAGGEMSKPKKKKKKNDHKIVIRDEMSKIEYLTSALSN